MTRDAKKLCQSNFLESNEDRTSTTGEILGDQRGDRTSTTGDSSASHRHHHVNYTRQRCSPRWGLGRDLMKELNWCRCSVNIKQLTPTTTQFPKGAWTRLSGREALMQREAEVMSITARCPSDCLSWRNGIVSKLYNFKRQGYFLGDELKGVA